MRLHHHTFLALALAAALMPAAHAQPGHGPISGGGGGGLPGANEVTESMLKVVNACTDEYVLTCETGGGGDFEWQAQVPFDSPTFTTKITTPSIVGGTSGTSTLTLDGDSTVEGAVTVTGSGAMSGVQYILGKSGSEFTLQNSSNNKINIATDGGVRWIIEQAYTAGSAYFTGGLIPSVDATTPIGMRTKRVSSLYTESVTYESANGAEWISGQVSELVTIAAAATTDTTIDLPADSVIRAVVTRATVAIPTATAYTVGDPTTAARFATACAVTLDATCVGTLQADQTGAAGPRQVTAAKVRITPNGTPADNTGRVRVTVFYDRFAAPAS